MTNKSSCSKRIGKPVPRRVKFGAENKPRIGAIRFGKAGKLVNGGGDTRCLRLWLG